MKYALSTLMFQPKDLVKSISFANELDISLEIFPLWHDEIFVRFMKEHLPDLRGIICSFHEPFNFCEHTAPRGSARHAKTVDICQKTFEYAANLGAKHLVFHHNNRVFVPAEKADMIKYATENLQEMNEIAAEYGIPYLVENAGVIPSRNNLLSEDEFIALFDSIENDCLLDIGHAHCNDWDFARVISSLGDRIKAYHIHNNDKSYDAHLRIDNGTLDMVTFKGLCEKFTPKAYIIFEYVEGINISVAELRQDITIFQN